MLKIRPFLRNKKGVSTVIGAMLLVVVVVVAVSGFAVVIAELQKSESKRMSNIAAVESEILKITHIDPVINGTKLEGLSFTLLNLNSRDARIVSVIINDRQAGNFTSTDEYNNQDNFNFYNRLTLLPSSNKVVFINFTNESYFNPEYNLSITEPLEITVFTSYANNFKRLFTPPKPVIKTSVEKESMGAFERDVLFLDGSDSYDDGSITGYSWTINGAVNNISLTGKKERVILNEAGPFYVSLNVRDDTNMIGVSDITIPQNMNFNPPPKAVIMQSIETEDLGVAYRDVLVLDGSQSYDEGGSVIGYSWLITNDANVTIQNVTGKKIRAILNEAGPFNVSLTVTDNTGNSDTATVRTPKNMNFNPPVSMTACKWESPNKGIRAKVLDINSNPYANVSVYFIRMSGNVTFSTSGGVTDSYGEVSTTITNSVSGVGVIQVRSGNLNPIDIEYPFTSNLIYCP